MANFERSGAVWPLYEIEPLNSPLLGPIVEGRQLRVCIKVGEFSFNGGDMRVIELGRVVIAGLPQSKMDQYFLDERIILNKCNHLHKSLALGT